MPMTATYRVALCISSKKRMAKSGDWLVVKKQNFGKKYEWQSVVAKSRVANCPDPKLTGTLSALFKWPAIRAQIFQGRAIYVC